MDNVTSEQIALKLLEDTRHGDASWSRVGGFVFQCQKKGAWKIEHKQLQSYLCRVEMDDLYVLTFNNRDIGSYKHTVDQKMYEKLYRSQGKEFHPERSPIKDLYNEVLKLVHFSEKASAENRNKELLNKAWRALGGN